MTVPDTLWGLPDAEVMCVDAATLYETEIEPDIDETSPKSYTVEEWSVHPPSYHLPHVVNLTSWVQDVLADDGELTEDGSEAWDDALDDDVTAAFQAALDLWASKVTFRMAKDLISTHTVTFDDQGEPLLDGERIYTRREER